MKAEVVLNDVSKLDLDYKVQQVMGYILETRIFERLGAP